MERATFLIFGSRGKGVAPQPEFWEAGRLQVHRKEWLSLIPGDKALSVSVSELVIFPKPLKCLDESFIINVLMTSFTPIGLR